MTRPLRPADALRVPVTVTDDGQPIVPITWPNAATAQGGGTDAATTTWRAVLLASASVGRPEALLRAMFPGFARPELRARIDVLRSGLQRAFDEAAQPIAQASDWLLLAADPTEKAAVGYRAGMAGAHWACVQMLGLSDTAHLSLLDPADPARGGDQQADLWGSHPWFAPADWLVEAKGGVAVQASTRRTGAEQLDSARSTGAFWGDPHVQALVSTRLDPLLQLVVEIGLPPGTTLPPGWDDPAAWPVTPAGGPPPPDPAALFWGRSLLGSALLTDDGTSVVRLEDGTVEARLLDLPGHDVQVGLLESAFQTVRPQLDRARELAQQGVPAHQVAAGVTADAPPDEADARTTLDALLGLGNPQDTPTRLLAPATDGPWLGGIVDRAGRVVVVGDSWRTDEPARADH